jgi:glycosyltransferase involved in cell wall biosynthesis
MSIGITVHIPTYNRSDVLLETLRAYDAQDIVDVDYEVVVVDDGSTDATPEILSGFIPSRYEMKVIRQANSGLAAARNVGIDAARGHLILFTNDDVVPDSGLLRLHWEAHRELSDPRVAVAGRVVWHPEIPLTTVMTHICGPGGEQFGFFHLHDLDYYDYRVFYTCNVSIQMEIFKKGHRFCSDFKKYGFEDMELGFRLQQDEGVRFQYRKGLLGFHKHYHSARTFVRRQFTAGQMATVFLRLHPEAGWCVGYGHLQGWMMLERIEGSKDYGQSLEEIEATLLNTLTLYDFAYVPGLDMLHHAAFEYFYFKGMTDYLLEPARAKKLQWYLFDLLVNRALWSFYQKNLHLIPEPDASRLCRYLEVRN